MKKNLLFVEFIDLIHVAEHNMLFAVDPRRDVNTGVGHWFHVTLDTGEEQTSIDFWRANMESKPLA